MLRQDSPSFSAPNGSVPQNGDPNPAEANGIDIQQALNQLEDLILASPQIPLLGRTLIDENLLVDQLDLIRLNLPSAFRDAVQIVQRRDEILMEAEQIAQDMVTTAERRAAQILDEMGLARQAEREAQQVRQQLQQDCDAMRSQTLAEVEQLRQRAQQDWEDARQRTLADCQAIQQDADTYADQVLRQMEQQFTDMLRVLHNGRQQLQAKADASTAPAPSQPRDNGSPSRPSPTTQRSRRPSP